MSSNKEVLLAWSHCFITYFRDDEVETHIWNMKSYKLNFDKIQAKFMQAEGNILRSVTRKLMKPIWNKE